MSIFIEMFRIQARIKDFILNHKYSSNCKDLMNLIWLLLIIC